jgi:hypothetical protein
LEETHATEGRRAKIPSLLYCAEHRYKSTVVTSSGKEIHQAKMF